MPLVIRPATIGELPALGDLCMRSKAVWGYDDKFMEACRDELSFDPPDLQKTVIAVAEGAGQDLLAADTKKRDASGNVKLKDIATSGALGTFAVGVDLE